ncbi:hypothetical protein GCM10029992_35910 [Glycomyces albus]
MRQRSFIHIYHGEFIPGVGITEDFIEDVAGCVPGGLCIKVVAISGDEGDQFIENNEPILPDKPGQAEGVESFRDTVRRDSG